MARGPIPASRTRPSPGSPGRREPRRGRVDTRARREPARASGRGRRAPDRRHVVELAAVGHAPEQEPASAHVSPPTNSAGKTSRSPKTSVSGSTYFALATLPRSTTCQAASRAEGRGQGARVAHEWPPVPRIRRVDVDAGVAPQERPPDPNVRGAQTLAGRDHHGARHPGHGTRERARVRELPTEIEAAQEAEDLAQRSALSAAKPQGQVEARAAHGGRAGRALRRSAPARAGRRAWSSHTPV